jgi:DNA-binding response OmpR family regulator
MKILLVEDNGDLAQTIKSEVGDFYVVDIGQNGDKGITAALTDDYDTVVISASLPDMTGIEACLMIREGGIKTPIMILVDGDDADYRIEALDAGADDCLAKPFMPQEFCARLRALTRRYPNNSCENRHVVYNLVLDMVTRTVTRRDKRIPLRRKEYDLLEYLILNKGNTVSKEKLLGHIWDEELSLKSNTLEVHVKTLRDKIDRDYNKKLIKTIRGFGYSIDDRP